MNTNPLTTQTGQGLVEYALILVGFILVVALILSATGLSLQDIYCSIAGALGAEICDGPSDTSCISSFDDAADLANWDGRNKDKFLTIVDGKICNSGNNTTYLNSCSKGFGDSSFKVDLSGISIDRFSEGNAGFDYWFRAEDDKNGYKVAYNAKWNNLTFYKVVNGKHIKLSSTQVPEGWAAQDLDLEIIVKDNTFQAFKDGGLILQATDDAYTHGQHGIGNSGNIDTCFDSINLQLLP